MPANNLIRRLMTRALRSRKTTPIRKISGPVGRRIEELEDRTTPTSGLTPAQQQLLGAYDQLPMSFVANEGQTAPQVQYLSQGNGYTLFLTPTGSVLNLQQPSTSTTSTSTTQAALALNLVGSNPQATVEGQGLQSSTTNYLIGNNPSDWHTNVPNYGQVAYQDVYPGINLVYYGNQQQLEYDFDVAPGANPGVIRFDVQGTNSISLDSQGNLILSTAGGNVTEHAPVIYQTVGGVQQSVAGKFVLLGQNQVGFQVGAYNTSLPLVIDPILGYSTAVDGTTGGGDYDTPFGITVDSSGDAYITGYSDTSNFATSGAFQTSNAGIGDNGDAYVAKLNATGTALIYCTYLGGSNGAQGNAIAVNAAGNAYVAGETFDNGFPTTSGAYETSNHGTGGNFDGFVSELNPTGTGLVYSTYLGGSGGTVPRSLALSSSGNVYVTGETFAGLPTTSGAFQTAFTATGGPSAFVTEFNTTGSGLVYSTYLSGTKFDQGNGIAVNSSGNAYVTGYATSTNFPTTSGAYQTSNRAPSGDENAFVTELNTTGTGLVYSTYLGGSTSSDVANGIALDSSGDAYVTGNALSTNFPTTSGAYQTTRVGSADAFVTELNPTGTGLVYSTYLGGSASDYSNGIAVNSSGNAYVAGAASSTNFPTTSGAYQTTKQSPSGDDAGFVTELNTTGTGLVFSTYLSGTNGTDYVQAIALDTSGNAYVASNVFSTNFPATSGAYQSSGAEFVTKFNLGSTTTAPSIAASFSPTSITVNGTSTLTFTITNSNTSTTLNGVAFTDTLPSGLTVTNGSSSVGGGTLTITGGNTITLSGASIASSSSLPIPVTVTGATAGSYTTTTGAVSSTNGGTGGTATSNTLTVVSAPSIAASFSPTSILVGGTTTLTFTITNSNASTTLTGVAFTDTLPSGLTVTNGSSSVGGGTLTITGGNTITLTGASVSAAGSLPVPVTVTGASPGNYTTTTGAVSSTNGGTGNTATSNTLTVNSPVVYNDSLNTGALSITQAATGNDALTFSESGGNYILTDTGGLQFGAPTGAGAGSITLSNGNATLTVPASAVTSITVTLGTGTNSFTFTGTGGASAAPISVNTGSTSADTIPITGAVSDSGNVSLTSGGTITESGSGAITDSGGTVTTSSVGGTTLGGANAISTFNATNATSGSVSLTNTGTLSVSGLSDSAGGTDTITNTGAVTFPNALTLGSGLTVSDTTSNTTFTGAVNGGYALTVTSSGTTTFSAAVGTTALASVSVSGGTTDLNGGAVTTTGSQSYGSVTLGASANLTHTGSGSLSIPSGTLNLGSFTLTDTPTTSGSTGTIGAQITGSGGITENGPGTLTIGGSVANTYTGQTSVPGGTLILSDSAGTAVPGNLSVSGGTVNWTVNNPFAATTAVTMTSGAIQGTGNSASVASVTDSGGTLGTGPASFTVSGASNFTGGTLNVNSGGGSYTTNSLSVNSSTTVNIGDGQATTQTLTVGAGGLTLTGATITVGNAAGVSGAVATLVLNGTVTSSGTSSLATVETTGTDSVSLGSGAPRSFSVTGTLTDAPPITNGALSLSGGTMILTGANTYTTTTISAGTLQIGNGGSTGTLGSGAVTDNAALDFDLSGSNTVSNAISGTGSLTQGGPSSSTVILTGSNSYGTTTINSGTTLQIGAGAASGSLGTGAITDNGSLVFDLSSSPTVSNAIGGTGTLTQSGTGTVTLSDAANTYSGSTTITSGKLAISTDTDLGTAPASFTAAQLNISGGGVLQTTGSVTLATNRGVTVGAGGGTFTFGGSFNYAGRFTGSGNTLTSGGSDFILTNSTGTASNVNFIVSANRLFYNSNNALGTGSVQVNSGASLNNNSGSSATTIANSITLLSGAGLTTRTAVAAFTNVTLPTTGTVIFNSDDQPTVAMTVTANDALTGTLTVQIGGSNTTVGPTTLSGTISGSGFGLTKTQVGTLILSGTDTYTGITTVSAGTLAINGSITSSVVNSGTLQGTGSITGNVSGTGTFSPGNSPSVGIMTITGNFTPSGTVNFIVNSPFATAGTDYDQYSVNGTVNLSGSTLTLTNNIAGSFPAVPTQLTLINHTSAGATTAGTPADGSTLPLGTNTVKLFYNGGDGNDVVIVNGSGVGTTYVSGTFAGDTNGEAITDADFGTSGNQPAVYGVSAFSTIGAAVAATSSSGQIIVNSGNYSEAVNITGTQTLTITGVNVAGAVTINSLATASGTTVQIQGSSTLTDGDATNTTAAGSIAGTGSLVKQNSGTLTLTGSNSYGTTTITGGTLQIGNGGTTGTLGSGSVTDNASLFIDLSSSINVVNAISGTGTLTLTSTAGSITQSTPIAVPTLTANASSGITLTSANTVSTFNATNTTSGNVSFTNSGALTVTKISNVGTGTITVSDTGNVSLTTGNVSTGSGAINLTVSGFLSETSPSIISTTGTLTTNTGTGTTLTDTNTVGTFNATNTTSGNVSFTNSGALTVTGISNVGTGTITVSDTGNVSLTTGNVSTGSGAINLTASGFLSETSPSIISTTGTLTTNTGTGTTLTDTNTVGTFNATNTTSGNVSFTNSGALTVTGISNVGTGTITVSDTGNVSLTTGNVSTGSGAINLTASGFLSETSPSIISTTGTLTTNTGTGTTLTDTNTVSTFNATNTTSGNVSFTNSGALTVTKISNVGTGTITVIDTGNVSLTTGNVSTGSGAINLTASGFLSETSPSIISTTGTLTTNTGTGTTLTDTNTVSTFNATNTSSGNVSFTNSGALTVTGISNVGTGTITVLDTGNVSLTTGNVSTGSGAINFTASGFLSETSPAIINTTGTLTTNTGTGTTLTDTNTVSTFNATNTTSGNVSLTNSASPLTITGISESGGTVVVINTGSISLTGNVTDTTGGNVSLTATGSGATISESGTAIVNTTGTLTTNSVGGTTLNNANTVGTFNATNTPGGNVSLVNTFAAFVISGISETGGTTTVHNTGSTTINGTGITSTGNIVVTTTANLTVSNPVASTGGSTSLSFGSNNTGDTANINAAVTASTTATLTGGTGNDTINVTRMGATNLTVNGGGVTGGGADQVNIYANTKASSGYPGSSGSGAVYLTDVTSPQTYIATVTGIGNDIIDVNDQNQAATSPPPAPNGAPINGTPAITTGSGVAAVATNGVDVLNYSGTAGLTTLNLVESTGTNTYNIQFVSPTVTGSKLPTTATNIQTSTKTDTANLFGTPYVNASNPGIDTFDVGYTTAGTTRDNGGSAVTYPQGGASYLATLNVYGEDEPNTVGNTPAVGDTFKVFPDAYTVVNIEGGLPTDGYGNTLILNAFGLTNPQIVPLFGTTALPDGEITSSNKATVTWNSIETFPVPLGLGGTFDFQPSTSPTQLGFLPVFPTDSPTSGQYANADDGWINPGAGAYDRQATFGAAGVPNSPGLATLLQTAEWGDDGGVVNGGEFQVSVAPNQTVQVSAYIGDTFGSGRDLINVYVGTPGNPYESLLNPSSSTFNTFSSTSYKYVSYSGMFNPGSSSTLVFTIDKPYGGTSAFWTISGLDVRPVGLIAPLTLTRADSAPFTQAQVADGLTVDTYNGSGAAPFAELTINPQYGTPYGTDIDPAVKGFQVQADARGDFTFQILRETGSGPSLITVTDVTGASGTGQVGPTAAGGLAVSASPYLLPNPVYQTYTLPVVRRIDFGPLGTPAASDSDPNNPNYLVFDNSPYISTAANALGWIGTAPTTFDSGGSPNNLQRDGVYGTSSTPGDFELDMPAANTVYSVTVLLGDPVNAESGMYVEVVDPATGTIIQSTPVTGANTAAGQSTSFTFPVTTDSSGRIRLRFGVSTGSASGFWTLQDVEVRPVVGTASPPLGTEQGLTLNGTAYAGTASGGSYTATLLPGTVTANGTTATSYTITGATPNALITVTTSLGTLTTADGGPTYTGVQVLASNGGMATFTITAPLSTAATSGTITVTEVTGASLGVFTQNYTGYTPPPPPGSPPTSIVQRLDFTDNGSPAQSGFTSVPNTTVYSSTIGYGWSTVVNGYDRGVGSVPAPYPANLYRAGAWGEGSGTFEVSVPAGSTDDVRVYVGDPYNAWAGITVSVDGSTPVGVDPVADRFGYVTVTGVTDTHDTGVVDITINGGIWVASGVDVATTGGLPTPATGASNPIPATGTRLEFASTAISGFTSVANTTVFTPGAQYGWSSPVTSFVRPSSEFPASSPLTPTEMQFYGSGAYGSGSSEFQIAVQPGATYTIRAYVSDPYNAWTGITISAEGGTTVSATATTNPPGMYTLTGQDVNGDGILSITISGPIWVLNGLDIVQSPNSLPAAP